MKDVFRIIALAGFAACATPAFADTCRTQTLPAVLSDAQQFEQTKDRAIYLRMGEAAEDCPGDGWVRLLLAHAEMVAFNQLEPTSKRPDQLDPANFAYIERAADHIQAFARDMPADVRVRNVSLGYTVWNQTVRDVITGMLRHADGGRMHPMITDPAHLPCDFFGGAVALAASSHQSRNVRSEGAFTLINRVVPACRASDDRLRKNPIVQRAQMILRRVDRAIVTDPEQIRRELASAKRDVDDFRDGREGSVGIWFESNETQLKALLERHKVDLAAEADAEAQRQKAAAIRDVPPADRKLWFTREHVGSDAVVHAIAISLAEQWSPTAAGTAGASVQDVAQARVPITRHVVELRDEAKEKGVIDAARPALKAAVTAFQTGVVRTPETQGLPGMPDWLYNSMLGVMDR